MDLKKKKVLCTFDNIYKLWSCVILLVHQEYETQ